MPARQSRAVATDTEFWAAFYGNGDITIDNATALLDDHLFPPVMMAEDFHLYLPKEIKRTQKGLANVLPAMLDAE